MQIDSRAPEAPEAAFAADDVSVVLLYYLESEAERLGIGADDTGGSGQRRERLAGLVDPDDSRIRERLREIPAARGVDVAEILRQDAYRERLLDVALERLRVGPDAPALRIGPGRREPERDGIGFGLVFGAEATLFQDTVLAFQHDAGVSRVADDEAVRVLGVHADWLEDGMRAGRALIADGSRGVLEVCYRTPQRLDAIEILHLARDREREIHRRISEACEGAGLAQINPSGVAAARADDKMQAYRLWCRAGGIETPAARLVPRGKGRRDVVAALLALLGARRRATLVAQPRHGTEGRLVEIGDVVGDDPELRGGSHDLARHATDEILPRDDLLIREARGNVRMDVGGDPRKLTIRLNVAWDGRSFVAESGYAQVAPDGASFIASRGRGGEVVNLGDALTSLCCNGKTGWRRVAATDSDVKAMCDAASSAAAALNAGLTEEAYLKHTGIDVVLEAADGVLRPVVLEANARPAGLSRSCAIGLRRGALPKVTSALFGYLRQRRRERSRETCPR